jgi:uncharacterized CHY-type Zn-finger protein
MINPARLKERTKTIYGEVVIGVDVDSQTRCLHYHSPSDIIAIKFKCCGKWFPCYECHYAMADHDPLVWPLSEFRQKAILCGACGEQLSIQEYFECGSQCPSCGAGFNPGCANHYHLYFET